MRHILIVEDDHEIRETLKQAVMEVSHCNVTTAEHGGEALKILNLKTGIDLILADIMMPIMDGLEFRQQQLNHPEFKNIPLIFLTANHFLKEKAEALHPYEFLNKPININDLAKVLENFFLLHPKK